MRRDKPVIKVGVNRYQYSTVEKVLLQSGQDAAPQDVFRFCHSLFAEAINQLAEKVLGVEADSAEGVWLRLHGYWVGACGLPAVRASVPVDEKAVEKAVEEIGVAAILESMDNFARILRDSNVYAWVDRMEFDEFMVRGVYNFATKADPFNRYRRVTSADYAKLLGKKRSKSDWRMTERELRAFSRALELRIGRCVIGKDFS